MGPSAAKRLQAAALTRWGPHRNFENVYSTQTLVHIKSESLAQLLTVRSNCPSRALPPVCPTPHSVRMVIAALFTIGGDLPTRIPP